MTPDELREIDARIAVAFFGWRWHKIDIAGIEGVYWYDGSGNYRGGRAVIPAYSTDPAAATMLWDKLREDHTVCVQSRAAYFRVTIFSWTRLLAKSKEESFGLALCKAAMAMAEAKGPSNV